ncbi:GntR family transcriptional regulator [Arsenicitalea aurantiaca]|uniref:GntR family transcriptional regulator n=1 Tax=Arsenicitalea aurantiaca TaxID=1783274 RepID=A0A433X5C0_9HYPH|nr:GntR family transcriptional regulator [Arsenicitalea aurantiaca]RUT29263.1 GntR family transcriptional regulator [Arsenicitalea aurantiaca]
MELRSDNEGYRRFREAMDKGRLRPGMVLTQNALCKILGLSLTPLRETLVLLEEYGLVEVRPRTGIQIVYPEVAFIRENFQFRIMIETHALRLFAQTDNLGWLADMRERHEQSQVELAQLGNLDLAIDRFVATDRAFHADIVAVLNNSWISRTHQRLQANIGMARLTHARGPFKNQLLETVAEHMRIIASLEAGDIEAAVGNLEAHFRASTHRTFAA